MKPREILIIHNKEFLSLLNLEFRFEYKFAKTEEGNFSPSTDSPYSSSHLRYTSYLIDDVAKSTGGRLAPYLSPDWFPGR